MALEQMGLGATLQFESGQAVQNMQRANASVGMLRTTFTGLGNVMRGVGRGVSQLATAFLPVGVAIGFAVRESINYEQAMADLAAQTGATTDQMKIFKEATIEVGRTTNNTMIQAANALNGLAKSGTAAQDAVEALTHALNVADAAGIDQAEGGRLLGNVMRRMAIDFADVAHVTDVFALAAQRSGRTLPELMEATAAFGPIAQQMGLSVEQSVGFLAAFSKAGIEMNQAVGGMRMIFAGLKGGSDVMVKALEQTGVAAYDAAGNFRPFGTIMTELIEKMSSMEDASVRNRIAYELFGGRGEVVFEALRRQGGDALGALISDLEASSEAMDETGNRIGAMAAMAATRIGTTKGAFDVLKARLGTIAVLLTESVLVPLANAVTEVTGKLSDFISVWKSLDEDPSILNVNFKMQKFGTTLVEIVVGMRAGFETMRSAWNSVKMALSEASSTFASIFGETSTQNMVKWMTVILGIGGVLGPIVKIGSVLGGLAAPLLSAVTAIGGLSTPLLIVGAVIAALVGGFMLFRKEGESVSETFGRLGELIQPMFQPLIDAWPKIREGFISAFDAIKGVVEFVGEKVSWLGTEFGWVLDVIKGLFSNAVAMAAPLLETFIKIWEAIFRGMVPALEVVWSVLQPILEIVSDLGVSLWEVVEPALKALAVAWGAINSAIQWAVNKVMWLVDKILWVIGKVQELVSLLPTEEGGLAAGLAGRLRAPTPTTAIPVAEVPTGRGMAEVLQMGGGYQLPGRVAEIGAERAAQSTPPRPEDAAPLANVVNENNVAVNANVDGRCVSRSVSRHTSETRERVGAEQTPYQTRAAVVHNSVFSTEPMGA